MKFIVSLILTALLSFAACLYLPWWSIAIAAFIVSASVPQRPAISFLTGFVALFLLWFCLAWYISNNNQHLLAHKMSMVMLKTNSVYALLLLTAFIGALVAGSAALAGSFVRPKKQPVA